MTTVPALVVSLDDSLRLIPSAIDDPFGTSSPTTKP